MEKNNEKRLQAAYALNLWTVSVSQIIDYNDVIILRQEYDTIMNNLNLERMPKDEALLDVIKKIMDVITYFMIEEGDKKYVEKEYQHKLKNALWSAVPNVAAVFATSDPIAMGLTLATQVGIGYMNYRRNKSEYELEYEKSKWEIAKNQMQQLNGLQKELFETAWRLADEYKFPDEYRLTQKQITEYNMVLMEENLVKRYNQLKSMRSVFDAYPAFWYQLGSTANSIYRSTLYDDDLDIKCAYKAYAIEAFERYYQFIEYSLLRDDVITAAWALEYFELLDLSSNNDPQKAKKLIILAENNAGNALDVVELCAFAYLRMSDDEDAIRLFHYLVSRGYNIGINTQILSGLYIKTMRWSNDKRATTEANRNYRELKNFADPQYILELPSDSLKLEDWEPEWNKIEEIIDKKEKEEADKKEKLIKAKRFYQKPILIVYTSGKKDIAEYFVGLLNENKNKIDPKLPVSSRMNIKDYKKKRIELEQKGTHIILLGESDEAKSIYKNVSWDYHKIGMRFVSRGNKTVILLRVLKNQQINELVEFAREENKKYKVKIPQNAATVTTFFEDVFSSVSIYDTSDVIVTIIAGIIVSPLLLLGEGLKELANGVQAVQNIFSMKDLDFLRYSLAIYAYLETQNALLPDSDNSFENE